MRRIKERRVTRGVKSVFSFGKVRVVVTRWGLRGGVVEGVPRESREVQRIPNRIRLQPPQPHPTDLSACRHHVDIHAVPLIRNQSGVDM